jgi:GntR family transcriptional regulator of arabinose operon
LNRFSRRKTEKLRTIRPSDHPYTEILVLGIEATMPLQPTEISLSLPDSNSIPAEPKPAETRPAETRRAPGDIPRHRAIYEALLAEIQTGLYKAGDRLPSEAALCERFQASRITVAKAFQTLQRENLVTRRPGSGTYVQQPPQQQPSLQFGLLIPDLGTTEIFEPICQGIMRSPAAKSHSLTWGHSSGYNEDTERAAERLCRQYIAQKVDGVFFAPTEYSQTKDEANHRIAALLEKANIPVVLLDRCIERYPDRSNFDLVGIDNHRAGFTIARHLLQSGAKRIAFAMRRNSAATVEARIAGARAALFASNPAATLQIISGDFEDSAYVRTMFDRDRPDGIFCANDVTAARLMKTLVALGINIPGEIKMAGVDDVSYAKFLPVPLTTIRQDCAEIGAVAMSTMLERLRQPNQPTRDILVRTELVIRNSTMPTD